MSLTLRSSKSRRVGDKVKQMNKMLEYTQTSAVSDRQLWELGTEPWEGFSEVGMLEQGLTR